MCGVADTTFDLVHVHTHAHAQVQETTDRQGSLVQRITSAHAEFEQLTSGQSVGEREAKLKELAAGYDAFQELCNNLSEGSKVSGTCLYLCTMSGVVCACRWFTPPLPSLSRPPVLQ